MSRIGSHVILAPFLGLCILCCTSCASSIMMPTQAIETPPADHALVTFIRATSYGGAIDFGLWDGDELIGVIDPKSYIQHEATPGEHVFLARAENWSYVKANLEEGRKYYILTNVSMGVWKARVVLVPITKGNERYGQSDIDKWMSRLKPTTPDPAKVEAYRDPRVDQVRESAAKVTSGEVRFLTLEATDYFD